MSCERLAQRVNAANHRAENTFGWMERKQQRSLTEVDSCVTVKFVLADFTALTGIIFDVIREENIPCLPNGLPSMPRAFRSLRCLCHSRLLARICCFSRAALLLSEANIVRAVSQVCLQSMIDECATRARDRKKNGNTNELLMSPLDSFHCELIHLSSELPHVKNVFCFQKGGLNVKSSRFNFSRSVTIDTFNWNGRTSKWNP